MLLKIKLLKDNRDGFFLNTEHSPLPQPSIGPLEAVILQLGSEAVIELIWKPDYRN